MSTDIPENLFIIKISVFNFTNNCDNFACFFGSFPFGFHGSRSMSILFKGCYYKRELIVQTWREIQSKYKNINGKYCLSDI